MIDAWWVLLDAAARAAFLGLVAALALRFWRRSIAVRHAMWVGVVLGMLALPLLMALAPRLTFTAPATVPSSVLASASTTVASGLPIAESRELLRSVSPFARAVGNQDAAAENLGVLQRLESLSWIGLLMALYLGVATVMLLSLARGGLLLRRLIRSARPIEDPEMQALATELLPGREVTLLSSSAVRVPLTAGFWRPRVFLPVSWRSWSEQKRCAVLAHELSHVGRHDFLWTLLAELNKCLYWFHPLAWIARRQIAAVAEQASDVAAAHRLGSKTVYARVLVEIAGPLEERPGRLTGALPAVPMASSSTLTWRVEHILRLSESGTRARSGRRAGAVAAAAFALLVLFIGAVELVANPAVPERPTDIDALIAELSDADPDRRARAAYELALDASYWDRAIPHLIALLPDDAEIEGRPPLRRSLQVGDRWQPAYLTWQQPSPGEVAVVSLASMSSRVIEPLIAALAHGDPVARRNAAWGLGELRNRPEIPNHGANALVEALGDPDHGVRAAAAWTLGDIRVRRAIPRLIEVLRIDSDARVRGMAANALGEIRAADAEVLLAQAAKDDPDRAVRKEARYALKEVLEHGF